MLSETTKRRAIIIFLLGARGRRMGKIKRPLSSSSTKAASSYLKLSAAICERGYDNAKLFRGGESLKLRNYAKRSI